MNFKNFFSIFFLIDLVYMCFYYTKILIKKSTEKKLNIEEIPNLFEKDTAE